MVLRAFRMLLVLTCSLGAGCHSTPLQITSSPTGALGRVQCGSRGFSVVTPASAELPRGGPCFLTLSKEGFEQIRVPITSAFSAPDADPTAVRQLGDRDAPFLPPAHGGIWSPAGTEIQKAPDVSMTRPRAVHIVLRPSAGHERR